MQVYPAIDIKGGRVVRWLEGESFRETVYGDDPLAQALIFAQQGANWIHVVDMDRALLPVVTICTVFNRSLVLSTSMFRLAAVSTRSKW